MEGEGLAAPDIQLGDGTGGLATVSALPMGLKNFVYPPGLTEPRIRSCHEEGLAASNRLQATDIRKALPPLSEADGRAREDKFV